MSPRAVGGVMHAAPAGPAAPGNLLDVWGAGWAHRSAFGAARSALAALLRARGVRRAWLPAYACPALAEGVTAAGAEPGFYPVSAALESELAPVARAARAGEAVIGVAFFGRDPGPQFADLARRRPDLLWIEDRAQAAGAACGDWAEAAIHSPRKLIGVADGGLLLAGTPLPAPELPALDPWAPEDARAADPAGVTPERWYGLFQAREASITTAPSAMSPRSLAALASTDAGPLAERRRRNWRRLAERLGELALWPLAEPDFVPLAFPIVTADAAASVAALAAERIWAPRHWAVLPSPAAAFPEAHALSRRLVSLPCDQRYDDADMDRVAEAALRLAPPQAR